MPRVVKDTTNRIELRLPAAQKSLIARAAALEQLDMSGFILRSVLPQAEAAIERAERIVLSEQATLRLLDLLENPPKAPPRLIRAAKAGQTLE